ncbi:hypothetical protein T4B_5067 [Trichinella pseudospiralis]|uniref:Uncharacterized protein n=1 Tax=Trichinella pseudospiralis TaxID=6337 RepID=A0A0V1INE6_TRIPS|nr:hypothetical protein T4A_13260 [Trichinella pseudospiralis]KRZ24382.1 hypothetical protein T4B_5067 [Trichinella pseudospiralis]
MEKDAFDAAVLRSSRNHNTRKEHGESGHYDKQGCNNQQLRCDNCVHADTVHDKLPFDQYFAYAPQKLLLKDRGRQIQNPSMKMMMKMSQLFLLIHQRLFSFQCLHKSGMPCT